MTINQLQQRIRSFRDERNWMQFHNHKDMAIALSIEAAELQELFLWKKGNEIEEVVNLKKAQITEEVADIAVYLFELADNLGIDIASAIENKLQKNAQKYPVEKARGSSKKYNEL